MFRKHHLNFLQSKTYKLPSLNTNFIRFYLFLCLMIYICFDKNPPRNTWNKSQFNVNDTLPKINQNLWQDWWSRKHPKLLDNKIYRMKTTNETNENSSHIYITQTMLRPYTIPLYHERPTPKTIQLNLIFN